MKVKILLTITLVAIIILMIGYLRSNNKSSFTTMKNSNSTFMVMTYNIASGHEPSGERNENFISDYFKAENLDIIGLNEVDINTNRSNHTNQLSVLSNKLCYNLAFSKSIDFQGGYYGNGLLSRYNIISQSQQLLYNKQNSEQRSLLHTIINVQDVNTNVLVTHLEYNNKDVRTKQLEFIKDYIQHLDGPIILMGDFNVESPSELDLLTNKLNVIYGSSIPVTYPSENSTLDYILYSKELNLINYTVDKKNYSDHYPVMATFAFKAMQ